MAPRLAEVTPLLELTPRRCAGSNASDRGGHSIKQLLLRQSALLGH